MTENYSQILAVGGKSNSLGRVNEIIDEVLDDKNKLEELYMCTFDDDAWVRMRAIDAIEKICRQQPEWLLGYVDRFQSELAPSTQSSIQWHLAQIYSQLNLTQSQKSKAISWLKALISTTEVDWIVAANAMKTLVQFAREGAITKEEVIALLQVQQLHKSNAVVKKANRLLLELSF